MVRAAEHLLVAALVVAHEIGPMPAAVEEDANLAVLAAHDDNRLQADLPSNVVAVVRNFAFVPEIDPDLLEDVDHFALEQVGIVIEPTMNAIRQDQLANFDV